MDGSGSAFWSVELEEEGFHCILVEIVFGVPTAKLWGLIFWEERERGGEERLGFLIKGK